MAKIESLTKWRKLERGTSIFIYNLLKNFVFEPKPTRETDRFTWKSCSWMAEDEWNRNSKRQQEGIDLALKNGLPPYCPPLVLYVYS
ncbi:DNA invertase Pin-like site-specific DNA recombinase [Neobacillus ginsengisoli]|uniref:DNA invertase Pin-like site-specific DNA recombinase n=1 Tax=Neobacillus ginsengisoli TaxID=904295 RepID=A0ABT9XWG7_9BACI|nr:DNA invertase Pin-like site-specific DNA recombinase [Neobacillus ginsengisoli]